MRFVTEHPAVAGVIFGLAALIVGSLLAFIKGG